jgi:hypothetical protein
MEQIGNGATGVTVLCAECDVTGAFGHNRSRCKETLMWDLGLLAATAAFFAIALAYTVGCKRLGSSEEKQR